MLGAVIRKGNNTLVADLPAGMMDLQTKLSSIGIQQTSDKIELSDEDGDQIRVKLYATEPEEVRLLSLLTPNRTLADANTSMELLHRANREFQPRLKWSLLEDGYRTLDDFLNDAKRIFSHQSQEDIKAAARLRFDSDPNIRVVISFTHDGEVEVFFLPMNDSAMAAANLKLEEFSDGNSSMTIEALRYANMLQNAIVNAIRGLADQSRLGNAVPLLKTHVGIYFGGDNSIAADELRAKELVGKITNAASNGSYTSEMAELVEELNAVKQRIAEKNKKSQDNSAAIQRLAEVTEAIDGLKGCSVSYDNHIVRQLVECIRVMSADEIEITFKGMPPRRYPLG